MNPSNETLEDVVRKMSRRFARLTGLDQDDFAQECWLGLLSSPGRHTALISRDACIRLLRRAAWHRVRDTLPSVRGQWIEPPCEEVLDVPWYLDQLTPRQREVVILAYWHDLSIKAIGKALDIHWTTAARIKHDALVRMRRAAIAS